MITLKSTLLSKSSQLQSITYCRLHLYGMLRINTSLEKEIRLVVAWGWMLVKSLRVTAYEYKDLFGGMNMF